MVRLGLGVSILRAFLIDEDLRAKRLADIYPDETFRFPLRLVTQKDRSPTPVAAAFPRGLLALLEKL